MKAVVLTALGAAENLKPAEVDRFDGPLPEGTIRVKMAMVGVSGAEVYARRGDKIVTVVENGVTRQMVYEGVGLGKPPYVAGKEGAGEVIEVGPGVDNVKVGDRVVWFSAQLHKPYTGALAEECVLHAKATTPVPEDISWGDAISMISTGLTAHYLAKDCYDFKPGDRAVLTTAGGALGTTLIQLLALQGVKVTGVVSNEAKADAVRQAGAEHVIVGYENYSEQVHALIGGAAPIAVRRFKFDESGAAVAFDGLGGDSWKEAVKSVRVRGLVVLFGHANGQPTPIDPMEDLTNTGSLSVMAPTGLDYFRPVERGYARYAELCQWIREGRLKPVIGATFPLERAAEAHALYDARGAAGKILISIP
jgi:NADPH2:quinone reductase